MENNEDIAKNPNNFPIKFVEQKESKHLYPYKKVIPEKEINKKKKPITVDKGTEKEEIELEELKLEEKKDEEKTEEENIYIKDENRNKKNKIKSEKKEEKEKFETNEENSKKKENIESNNKSTNNNTFNNNESKTMKELQFKLNDIIKNESENNDKLPPIKNGSYLTELPSEAYSKKNITSHINSKYKESSRVMKYLKEKELSLNKEINSIKDKKEKLMNISLNNIGLSDIDKNRNNYEKKQLQTLESNLLEKLNDVKLQIKGIIQREKILKNSKSTLIQNFIKKYEDEDLIDIQRFLKNNNKKKTNINSHKENITKIDEKKEPQGVDKVEGGEKSEEQITLSPKEKSEEQIKEEKRKEKIKEEVLKLEKNPSKQNYLFFKMENSYEEREKLFYKNMKLNRKINILGKEELKHFYQKFKEQQKELKEKANTKKIELKKEWRSNSLLLPKYKSPIMNIIKKEENEKIKEKCEEKNIKRKNLEKKFNIEIPLPKISEKLRKENLKQNLNLNSLQGVHRVKYIKDELDKIKETVKKEHDIEKKRYKQSNMLTRHRINDKIFQKKLECKTLNKVDNTSKSNKGRKAVIKNYLNENKKNSNKKIIWDRYLNEEDNKVTNIKNIKGQIEGLDNNVEIKKEIIKINGGILNNNKLGNDLSNILINSINGKISLIKAMNY